MAARQFAIETGPSMLPYRVMLAAFGLAVLAYVGIGAATFAVPLSLEAAQACGFTADDFNAAGVLELPPLDAWWVSFLRKQEYLSALCMGLASSFIAFAVFAARRIGMGAASGAVAGGGLLAFGAVCIGCLAPALSAVGIGLAGSLLADMPKWLMALNTFILTGWGTLFLARRLSTCAIPAVRPPVKQSLQEKPQ